MNPEIPQNPLRQPDATQAPQPAPMQPSVQSPQMTQPYPLTLNSSTKKKRMILIGGIVAAVVALVVGGVLVVPKFFKSSEEKVVRSFLQALKDQDCDMMYKQISKNALEGQSETAFKKRCELGKKNTNKEGVIVSVTLESNDGTKAKVKVVTKDSPDKEVEASTVSLVKEDGDWKIDDVN